MTKRVIEHNIKLEKSVKIILAVLAFGVLAHAFGPALNINSAFAKIIRKGDSSPRLSVRIIGPITLKGKIGLDGQLGVGGQLELGGQLKCIGCATN